MLKWKGMEKKCFRCRKVKSLEEFYMHKQMADGHLGKCKACTKKDVRQRYYDPLFQDRIREYEQTRAKSPDRRKKRLEYQRSQRQRHPGKNAARAKVGRALKTGKLIKSPCMVCGSSTVEAHHEDYRSPLKVTWLCRNHHMEIEGKNSWLKE